MKSYLLAVLLLTGIGVGSARAEEVRYATVNRRVNQAMTLDLVKWTGLSRADCGRSIVGVGARIRNLNWRVAGAVDLLVNGWSAASNTILGNAGQGSQAVYLTPRHPLVMCNGVDRLELKNSGITLLYVEDVSIHLE